ncbi:hypothetical protein [Roseobacter weihaiensis]|uniref:hypothetical protein n=1 Tax=Roseobacter weihaiensis TaxID=2763262 RepID=UPI001D0B11A8|nr:hypothetical protein [Roseobacter sp. H9]
MGFRQVALNRLLYGLVVPVLIVLLVASVVPVESIRLACSAAVIAAGFMMMRVPAVTFTEEWEAGLCRLLMHTGHVQPSRIQASVLFSALPLVLLPMLSFFCVLAFMGAHWDGLFLIPISLLCLWFLGLGLSLLAFHLSLISVQLVADIVIVGIIVFSPIFYGLASGSGVLLDAVAALPPTLFFQVASGIAETGALPWDWSLALLLWAIGTLSAGLFILGKRL